VTIQAKGLKLVNDSEATVHTKNPGRTGNDRGLVTDGPCIGIET
jgi:hypothetical protein